MLFVVSISLSWSWMTKIRVYRLLILKNLAHPPEITIISLAFEIFYCAPTFVVSILLKWGCNIIFIRSQTQHFENLAHPPEIILVLPCLWSFFFRAPPFVVSISLKWGCSKFFFCVYRLLILKNLAHPPEITPPPPNQTLKARWKRMSRKIPTPLLNGHSGLLLSVQP